ncbi:MAG: hypothetical protein HYR74_06155 [Candidatus Eisenbacteria bacterium]|nr:hypothetical protein [Candidatus Eisenbacteria bacterium]
MPASRHVFWVVPAACVLIAAAVAMDLGAPIRSDIRIFDADRVARLDTEMWRAYYDRKPLPLFLELAEVMRRQFHVPFLRSYLIAGEGARAAFVFKRGHVRADYEQALPDLRRYFTSVRAVSVTPFDVERAARLELEWWIAHRVGVGEDSLAHALDLAEGELYRVPPERLEPYGHERAKAMILRDGRGDDGRVSDQDWSAIQDHLRIAWNGLERVLTADARAAGAGGTR